MNEQQLADFRGITETFRKIRNIVGYRMPDTDPVFNNMEAHLIDFVLNETDSANELRPLIQDLISYNECTYPNALQDIANEIVDSCACCLEDTLCVDEGDVKSGLNRNFTVNLYNKTSNLSEKTYDELEELICKTCEEWEAKCKKELFNISIGWDMSGYEYWSGKDNPLSLYVELPRGFRRGHVKRIIKLINDFEGAMDRVLMLNATTPDEN